MGNGPNATEQSGHRQAMTINVIVYPDAIKTITTRSTVSPIFYLIILKKFLVEQQRTMDNVCLTLAEKDLSMLPVLFLIIDWKMPGMPGIDGYSVLTRVAR